MAATPVGSQLLRIPETCAICLEISDRPCLLEPCGHCFCLECIESWSATQMRSAASRAPVTCPLCKSQLTHLIYDIVSPYEYKRVLVDGSQRVPALSGLTPGCDSLAHRGRRHVYLYDLQYSGPTRSVPAGVFSGRLSSAGAASAFSAVKSGATAVVAHRLQAFITRELQALLQIADVAMIECIVTSEVNSCGTAGVRTQPHAAGGSIGIAEFLKRDTVKFLQQIEAFYAADTSVAGFDAAAEYSCAATGWRGRVCERFVSAPAKPAQHDVIDLSQDDDVDGRLAGMLEPPEHAKFGFVPEAHHSESDDGEVVPASRLGKRKRN